MPNKRRAIAALRTNYPRPFGLPPNADDCKAPDEAKGGSLGEERNDAGAAFGGNASHAVNVNRPYSQQVSRNTCARAQVIGSHRFVRRRIEKPDLIHYATKSSHRVLA